LVTREGIRFNVNRFWNTFRLVVKNKMALVGLALLIGFVFIALAAPILTSYGPGDRVAGNLAQPEWVMNYPDGYYLSQNVVVPTSPLISSPSDVESWTLIASPSTVANLQEVYSSSVRSSLVSHGSIQITYTGSAPTTVRLAQSLQFPYRGPPADFEASVQYLVTNLGSPNPVQVNLFIERTQPTVQDFLLPLHTKNLLGGTFVGTDANDTGSSRWLPPSVSFFGSAASVTTYLGTSGSGLSPAQVIFSASGQYLFGIQMKFYGPATVNFDTLQLKVLGSAYGLLGTDYAGADIYTQFVYGSRVSLLVGLLSAGIGISLGLVVGLLAGFLGRYVDEVLMRFTDMMLVIPGLPLLIVLVAVLGPNIWNLIIVIGFLGWMGFARIVRSQVLTIRERPFIEASRASGAGTGRIIVKHIFPNLVSLTYVNLALTVPGAILSESALAFLGLSDPSLISWGHMFEYLQISGVLVKFPPAWWWVLPPGFGIALVSLSFILIGYALDEIFNPRLRKRR
jgi:ABC-type dipeptide/oligopeptide/nickel transport system permease subunit